MSKGGFSGGDKHTGWKTPDGRKLTDNEAKAISDAIPKHASSGDASKGGKR